MPPKPSKATSVFLDLFGLSPARADLKLLGELSQCFASLPWENLTKLIKNRRPPEHCRADLPEPLRGIGGAERLRLSEEVMADHARWGAGGTCFSLTNALARIAGDLGYRVWPAMADMRHGRNIHCGLVVEFRGGRYLIDPGYLVAEPVPLDPSATVRVRLPGHSLDYRPSERGDGVELYTVNDRGEETFRYRLWLRPTPRSDFVRFWVASFDSNGMNGLHLNRLTSEGRLSAHNLNLRIDTGRDKTNVRLRGRYVEWIATRFGIDDGLVRRAFGEWERSRCPGR